jgi:2,3-diaminopropionate biosynthesis protein SbnA
VIHDSVLDCVGNTPVVALRRLFADPGVEVVAKLEFLNPGGSVKDRPAMHIIGQGLRTGRIAPGSHIVESSSGNFGVALAMVCRVHRLPLTIVVDPNVTSANLALLREFGATVDMVRDQDTGGGYLQQRLRRVRELVDVLPGAVWVNQYASELNWQAHARTGQEIIDQIPGGIDVLVAAVSTAGTIHGVARALRATHPRLRVVAVDAVGSVIFGGAPGPRRLPGIGASRTPELLRAEEIDEVVMVDDQAAILGCRRLLSAEGILAGGSSGSIVAALDHLIPRLARPVRVLTLLPDRGERYLDIVYGGDSSPVPSPAAKAESSQV